METLPTCVCQGWRVHLCAVPRHPKHQLELGKRLWKQPPWSRKGGRGDFPCSLVVKTSNAGGVGLIPDCWGCGFDPWLGNEEAYQVVLEVKYLPTSAGEAGDSSSVSGLGNFPGVGNGKPTLVFLPRKLHGRGAWSAILCGVAESHTTERTHTGN